MLRICAWCKKEIGGHDSQQGCEITHGICESCKVTLLSSHSPRSIHKYLSYFTLPVMMVNSEGRVLSANKKALEIIGKELDDISHNLGGNVMSCQYAYQEKGCGETVHCVACTIRNNVIRTHETGESLCEIPANLQISSGGQDILVDFLISTEKLADVVLLAGFKSQVQQMTC
jgi:hypothetical protein